MISPEENCDDGTDDNIGCKTGCNNGYNADVYCYGGNSTSPTICDKCGNMRIETGFNETCDDGN